MLTASGSGELVCCMASRNVLWPVPSASCRLFHGVTIRSSTLKFVSASGEVSRMRRIPVRVSWTNFSKLARRSLHVSANSSSAPERCRSSIRRNVPCVNVRLWKSAASALLLLWRPSE